MWNSEKSVRLSIFCTRLVMVLLAACAVLLPRMMEWYGDTRQGAYAQLYAEAHSLPLMIVLYLCCIPAASALVCLDRLLCAIRKGDVFVERNVTLLRILSWCCFAVALLFFVAGRFYVLFFAAGAAAGFIGLILRVVKNVIQQAVLIKAENDFTI